MSYDLFISYAHQGDNTSPKEVESLVTRLHAELEADFRRRFNRDLKIFFDKENIRDFEHWQVSCLRWTPKTGPQVKMDFRWSASEKKADYESKTQTA